MDYKDTFKKDDHRDEDEIDVALKKLSPEEKRNGQLYCQRMKFLIHH